MSKHRQFIKTGIPMKAADGRVYIVKIEDTEHGLIVGDRWRLSIGSDGGMRADLISAEPLSCAQHEGMEVGRSIVSDPRLIPAIFEKARVHSMAKQPEYIIQRALESIGVDESTVDKMDMEVLLGLARQAMSGVKSLTPPLGSV